MGFRALLWGAIGWAALAAVPAFAGTPAVGLPSHLDDATLPSTAAPAEPETPAVQIVVRSTRNPGAPITCSAATPKDARQLAEAARRDGDHRKAAACYRVAGDPVAADRAQSKAFIENGELATRKASATIDEAREQARRVREAFRAKPGERRS